MQVNIHKLVCFAQRITKLLFNSLTKCELEYLNNSTLLHVNQRISTLTSIFNLYKLISTVLIQYKFKVLLNWFDSFQSVDWTLYLTYYASQYTKEYQLYLVYYTSTSSYLQSISQLT